MLLWCQTGVKGSHGNGVVWLPPKPKTDRAFWDIIHQNHQHHLTKPGLLHPFRSQCINVLYLEIVSIIIQAFSNRFRALHLNWFCARMQNQVYGTRQECLWISLLLCRELLRHNLFERVFIVWGFYKCLVNFIYGLLLRGPINCHMFYVS